MLTIVFSSLPLSDDSLHLNPNAEDDRQKHEEDCQEHRWENTLDDTYR